jgi:transcriptional regulator with XRE-family HTH domain
VSQAATPSNIKQMTVPQRIKWLRKQAGSHDRLATRVGTTRQVIIRWEKGQNSPSATSRQRLANYSGLPSGLFRDGDEEDDEESELVNALLVALRAVVRHETERVPA